MLWPEIPLQAGMATARLARRVWPKLGPRLPTRRLARLPTRGAALAGFAGGALWWCSAAPVASAAAASDDGQLPGSSIEGEWDQDVAACESMGPFLSGLGVPWFATKLVDCLHTALSIRCGVRYSPSHHTPTPCHC